MKYKVGDVVEVRADLKCGVEYHMMDHKESDSAVEEMLKLRGKNVTIAGYSANEYRIKEDDEEWHWTDEMFAGLAKNYKVRCTGYNQNYEKYFTIGKVYDVVNNTIKSDGGFVYKMFNAANVINWLSRWYKFERVSDDDKKIVITTDGKTTTAALYDVHGNVVKSAEAKRNPKDAFDFTVGAKLALERLTLTPHMESNTEHYCNIGEATNYKDVVGRPLCVGDTVELYDYNGKVRGEFPIVRNKAGGSLKTFVMSIETSCNERTGTTGRWKILKKRSFNDVKDGEVVGMIKYVKKG